MLVSSSNSSSSSSKSLNVCQLGSSGLTNTLHGCLLTIQECLNRCRDIALSVEDWQMIRKVVNDGLGSLERDSPSFYIKLAVLKLFQTLGLAGDWRLLKEGIRHSECRLSSQLAPGYGNWIRLKTELVLQHCGFACILPSIEKTLSLRSAGGLDIAEAALKILTHRVARLSSSSVLANSMVYYVNHYILHAEAFPSLLPICLEFVRLRGATCLVESETSLKGFADFFLDKCIESKAFGITTVLIPI